MTLKPLVFFGTEDFSLPSLQALIEIGWPIKLVVTKPDSKKGRGLEVTQPAVKSIAQRNHIPVLQPQNILSIKNHLLETGAELAVLVAYGKIIPAEIINIFPAGVINVHPSLLPKYRGPAPIEAAIINGDKVTGVTLMKLSPKMDAGPIYLQEEILLTGAEERPELYKKLANIGSEMLAKHLEAIAAGSVPAIAQNDSLASYTKLLSKDDGLINLNEPAVLIERKIRAYLDYPRSYTTLLGQRIIITKATATMQEDSKELALKTASGILVINELIAPSGRKMSGKDFLRGYAKP